MTERTNALPTRCPRWVRILLALSLAANLAIAGMAVGAALRFGGPDGAHHTSRTLSGAMIRALPDEDRRALREQVRGDDEDRGARRQADGLAVVGLLRAQPFDTDALRLVLDEQAARHLAFRAAVATAWLDHVAAMSDAERAGYADHLERLMERDRDHRHRRRD